MNGQIPDTHKKKPFRNWKTSGKNFYGRNGRVHITHEKVPAIPLDDDALRRRIMYKLY